jgi:hypothetical protein
MGTSMYTSYILVLCTARDLVPRPCTEFVRSAVRGYSDMHVTAAQAKIGSSLTSSALRYETEK